MSYKMVEITDKMGNIKDKYKGGVAYRITYMEPIGFPNEKIALIWWDYNEDGWKPHDSTRTSFIEKIEETDEYLRIETLNSIYLFEKIKDIYRV